LREKKYRLKRLRGIWANMRSRCSNPKNAVYPSYGGRVISVCSRWEDFSCFVEDMGMAPGWEYSLDRINNDGNYEPGNCRWATRKQQQNNRRNNILITFGGEALTVAQLAEIFSITNSLLRHRLLGGWELEKALTSPSRGSRSSSKFLGVSYVKRMPTKPWRATIVIEGKALHLGYFPSEVAAAKAYDAECIRRDMNLRKLNFRQKAAS
jgi:hypothetical protein